MFSVRTQVHVPEHDEAACMTPLPFLSRPVRRTENPIEGSLLACPSPMQVPLKGALCASFGDNAILSLPEHALMIVASSDSVHTQDGGGRASGF